MSLKGIKWGNVGWINPAPQRNQCVAVMNKAKDLQIPYNVGNF